MEPKRISACPKEPTHGFEGPGQTRFVVPKVYEGSFCCKPQLQEQHKMNGDTSGFIIKNYISTTRTGQLINSHTFVVGVEPDVIVGEIEHLARHAVQEQIQRIKTCA